MERDDRMAPGCRFATPHRFSTTLGARTLAPPEGPAVGAEGWLR
jgi:hypothetical protein